MSMPNDPIPPEGWSLQKVKFHHGFFYWSAWALYLLSSLMPGVNPEPPTADVSYTLLRHVDGKIETVRLSGDHAPDALSKTMRLLEATSAPEQS